MSDDFFKGFFDRIKNKQDQLELRRENQRFQKQQTDRVVEEHAKTNQELKAINENQQKQIDEAKRSAKFANIKSWISIGVSIASVIAALIVGFCT